MNKNEIDGYERSNNVSKTMEAWLDLWSNKSAVVKCMEDLQIENTVLGDTMKAEAQGSKPATKGKKSRRQKMKYQILWLGGLLCTYAAAEGNAELKQAATMTPTKLDRLRDSRYVAFGEDLLARAGAIGTFALEEYGLDDVTLAELNDSMDEYKSLVNAPRLTISELKSLRKRVKVHLNNAREIIFNRLRNLLTPFKETNPDFWEAFEASTIIVNTGGKKSGKDGPVDDSKIG